MNGNATQADSWEPFPLCNLNPINISVKVLIEYCGQRIVEFKTSFGSCCCIDPVFFRMQSCFQRFKTFSQGFHRNINSIVQNWRLVKTQNPIFSAILFQQMSEKGFDGLAYGHCQLSHMRNQSMIQSC